MTTLYKKDSKGKIRVWLIFTEGADVVQQSGLYNGNLVTNRKTCKSKNVGKSNETSPQRQALMEMVSTIASKIDEGYFRTLQEAFTSEVLLPMLAKDFKKEAKKIDWTTAYGQPKLDGMRCLGKVEEAYTELISRDGKSITTMTHIADSIDEISEDCVLDGELYAHGKTFQENMRLIKKYREGESEEVQYHVYDLVDSGIPFVNRYAKLVALTTMIPNVNLVETVKVNNQAEYDAYHAKCVEAGYEGSMLRWGSEGYRCDARSSHLLKRKDFLDIAAKIVDVEPAEQRPEWGVPVLEFEGKRFRAGMKFSHEERKEFLLNKNNYIGQTAEIRFFEYSDEGIPRFPVCVGFRLDK